MKKEKKLTTVRKTSLKWLYASSKSVLGRWQEWASLALLLFTLGIAVRNIEVSSWISPQPALTLVLGLSMLTCLIMYRSLLPLAVTLPLNLVIGAGVMLWQTLSIMPLWTSIGVKATVPLLRSLWQMVSTGRPSENTIFFALFIVFLVWVISYISTWYVLQRKNAWVGALLGALAIMVNLYNLSEDFYIHFLYYILAAMVLIAFMAFTRRYIFSALLDIKRAGRVASTFIASALCFIIVLSGITWIAPEIRASEIETLVSTRLPGSKDIESYWINLFAAVPSKTTQIKSSHQQTLMFASPLNLSQDVQFVITSSGKPSFWRARRFDVYTSWGWSNSQTLEQSSNETALNAPSSPASKLEIAYTVVSKVKTDVMLTAGELVSTGIQGMYYSLLTPGAEAQTGGRSATAQALQTDNIMAITTARMLKPNDSYQAAAIVRTTTADELSGAGQDYPSSVSGLYLKLPESLPVRIRQLSQGITVRARVQARGQAQTAYDKVMVIKRYLSSFTYNETGTAPPGGVDYFLSTVKTGNCTNFASAMVVMLRSVGVPARFVTGYLPREFDANTGTATIRAKDYHAWPEVYFPSYGWIEFEATPLPDLNDTSGLGIDDMPVDTGEEAAVAENTLPAETSRTALYFAVPGIVLFLFILISVIRRRLRHLTPAQYASEMYSGMCRYASLLKIRLRDGQTPLEYSQALVSVFPAQAESIGNIADAYIKTTFSQRKELDAGERQRLSQSWRRLSHAFFKKLLRLGR